MPFFGGHTHILIGFYMDKYFGFDNLTNRMCLREAITTTTTNKPIYVCWLCWSEVVPKHHIVLKFIDNERVCFYTSFLFSALLLRLLFLLLSTDKFFELFDFPRIFGVFIDLDLSLSKCVYPIVINICFELEQPKRNKKYTHIL